MAHDTVGAKSVNPVIVGDRLTVSDVAGFDASLCAGGTVTLNADPGALTLAAAGDISSDGVVSLMTAIHAFKAMGMWQNEPQSNLLDGGAHFYDTYRCADGKYVSIGSIESPFYSLLAEKLDLDLGDPGAHFDRSLWPVMKARIAERIQTKSRDEWCELLEGSDVCFAPVLDMEEAPNYPHNHARGNFVEEGGFLQPAPAPRFSRTPSSIQGPPAGIAEAADAVLASLGYSPDEVAELKACGAVAELKACGAVAALQ